MFVKLFAAYVKAGQVSAIKVVHHPEYPSGFAWIDVVSQGGHISDTSEMMHPPHAYDLARKISEVLALTIKDNKVRDLSREGCIMPTPKHERVDYSKESFPVVEDSNP